MSKIYGDKSVIERARSAKPGDKSVYINWDTIDELSEEYEVLIVEVKFDPQDLSASFSDVGNNTWMPSPALHYAIAEAKGISGGENSITNPIYEEVDISEMNMAAKPHVMKKLVGYQVTKYSTTSQGDGTIRRSSPCTIPYNVWNRCLDFWAKEEEVTKGYLIEIKNGKYRYYEKDQYGDYYTKGKFNYPVKYNTKWKRKAHFQKELKFAQQMAETKSYEKAIREISALETGYKTKDLQNGSLVFAKIQRSREILEQERVARLSALSNNENPPETFNLLFGKKEKETPASVLENPEPSKPVLEKPIGRSEPSKPVLEKPIETPEPLDNKKNVSETKRELLCHALQYYIDENHIPEKTVIVKDKEVLLLDTINNIITWLTQTLKPEEDINRWDKSIERLKEIEAKVPDFVKFKHDLY